MSAEQQLREAHAWLTDPNFEGSVVLDAFEQHVAAVGRLLEPIPDFVDQMRWDEYTTTTIVEAYQAWLIGGDDWLIGGEE